MATQTAKAARAPWWVTIFGPIAKSLLAARVPLGFNGLITIRGRTSGQPRTIPIAIIVDSSGRRWVWAPWGDVQWVRNLRVAGSATITVRGRKEEVRAVELDRFERIVFFRDILPPIARGHPVRGQLHPHRRWDRSRRPVRSGRGSLGLRTPACLMPSAARADR